MRLPLQIQRCRLIQVRQKMHWGGKCDRAHHLGLYCKVA
jgi:hypothetical protein